VQLVPRYSPNVASTEFHVSVPLKEKKRKKKDGEDVSTRMKRHTAKHQVLLAADGQQLSLGLSTDFVQKSKVLENEHGTKR
jgi:hypothetical protein